jgi:hypothetical protein
MKSRASLADVDSSSGDRADGKPYCDTRSLDLNKEKISGCAANEKYIYLL